MIASMTGFGRALIDAPFGKLIVEIQSVNRKHLELFVSMPKDYGRFEHEIRKWVSEAISRGQVSLRIYLTPSADQVGHFLPDLAMLKQLKEGWEGIAGELGYGTDAIDLPFLMQNMPSLSKQETARDEDLDYFKKATAEALTALVQMKRKEGQALAHDIQKRLGAMEHSLAEIEKMSPDAVTKMKKKLHERIVEAAPNLADVDERVLREIAMFAEKVDIAEEITRFRSHLVQFHELLKEKAAIGRKMDFLVQEMGREINTIGSKSLESKISHLVVEVKSELEKIREQIQNIE
ncbi:MAG: YicC family protein [Verrucomicrobia bacterium]|nr:YicC family protein [Verrucomicrobiota bacterium]